MHHRHFQIGNSVHRLKEPMPQRQGTNLNPQQMPKAQHNYVEHYDLGISARLATRREREDYEQNAF
jgi:hypothetical protein